MPDNRAVTRKDVEAAYAVIASHVRRTPVVMVEAADLGLDPGLHPIAFKLEQTQQAGSFKTRGAMNNILTADIPAAGVVAASGGNHGAALAYAAQTAGVPCTIFVFDFTPAAKADRIRGYGATVIPVEGGFDRLMDVTHAHAKDTGALIIHAYDMEGTLAGQGTVALEFLEQAPVDTLMIATGGGGLIGGISAFVEHRARIISVEPEGAPTLFNARAAGHPVPSPAGGLAADSLGPGQVGDLMFPITQAFVDDAVLVTDAAIDAARRLLWEQLRLVVEPGGATALAALISGVYTPGKDERVGVLLCGANTNVVQFPD
ncbi:MAG: threonine/serine dehydratase [Alphaproteobacteria bacterium]|nr:threonine/serine dehydratase [Alphaproteobacteria bacterium]NNF72250.1 threonine/serine dehydratase [Paracoccaceae bacterium]